MPIKINGSADDLAKVNKQIFSAKFFSKDITGSGKTTGLINTSIYPINLPAATPENIGGLHWHIRSETNKYCKINTYPINPLGCYFPPQNAANILNFDASSWCPISGPLGSYDYYVALVPVAISITEPLASATNGQNSTSAPTGKRCSIRYSLMFIRVDPIGKNVYVEGNAFTENPLVTFTARKPSTSNLTAFMDYLSNYNLHAEICRQSERWQTELVDMIIRACDNDRNNFPIEHIIRYIAQYKVTLQQYKYLYTALASRYPASQMKKFTKMNTSLLLQDTLSNLGQIQFASLPTPGATNKTLDLSWCSKEQFDAITSASPLNLVQAGAGTGKSTVIKSRLDYLDYLGVDMNKVMVLSFTNAAADNIKTRCPSIQSMTIAKMIDTIYTKNHPTHQLSPSLARRGEGSTFTNSIALYRGSLPMVAELTDAVNRVEKYNDYATLLRLVEENYDDVMKILDTVGQTTFHLEIIICYLEHASMTIPFNIEHLLIDEVQDNAVFEFIFFLNLTCKLGNHLYLVGDCSQTLYEFRASDPKALNAIEGSKLFATFPLNINYRSNQDILSFANVLLDDIDANQYANIQLQSFKLNAVTKQSFAKAVNVNYNKLDRKSELEGFVRRKLGEPDMTKWIEDKLSRNEQICILTYKRRESMMFQKAIEELYPNCERASIIPAKNISFAYFSKYVSGNKQQLMALPTNDAKTLCSRIKLEIIANLSNCNVSQVSPNYAKILASVQKMLTEWEAENTGVISDAIAQFNAGTIDHQRLAEIVGETLIDFEIQKNALKQSLVSQKNASKKENTDSANFIFSTIHSAKGLEFDNVILLYENKNQMEEDTKRMYYVALTRAKKSEYILAFDTVSNAVVQTRYDSIMARLPDAAALAATP